MRNTLGPALLVATGTVLAAALLGAVGSPPAWAESGTADGKQVFLANKCNLCHAVSSAGIEATAKSDKMKGPDLKGAVRDKSSGEVAKFLQQEGELDGQKHKKGFKGSDEELQALVDWLLEQE